MSEKVLSYFPHGGAVVYDPMTEELVFIKEGREVERVKVSKLKEVKTKP